MIGVPLARAVPPTTDSSTPAIINSNVNKPADKTQVQSTTTPTDLKVEAGTEPNTLIVNFPAGTKENVVIAALGPLGLSIIHSDVATGRYLFALPKVSVFIERADGPDASDKAWINFPRIYSAEDIDTYFGKNNLKIDRWSLDPETGDRFAVVDLPRLEAKLIDPEQGLYTITLMPTDQESLDAWARESGVRIIQYDAKTGETVVQPVDWKAPTIVENVAAPVPTSAPAKITSPTGAHSTSSVRARAWCRSQRTRWVVVCRRHILDSEHRITAAECITAAERGTSAECGTASERIADAGTVTDQRDASAETDDAHRAGVIGSR